jgi:hypothetical protein
MKRLAIIVFAAALCGSAQAAVVSFSDTIGPTGTDWSGTLDLYKFDPSLGTLTEVRLALNGSLTAFGGYENTKTFSQTARMLYYVTQSLGFSATDMPAFTMNTVGGSMTSVNYGTVAAFDGILDYAGASGKTVQFVNEARTDNYVYTTPADLAKFVGTGSLVYDLVYGADATAEVTMGGSGANTFMSRSYAGAGATVEYVYTPVPEPMTLGLLGLGGLLLRRRMA